jgi:hypothetical protein
MTESKILLDNIVTLYLQNSKETELECRFGTSGYNVVTRIDFDNIIGKLTTLGFSTDCRPTPMLKVQSEYIDKQTGEKKISSIRTEITGIPAIQDYCKSNTIVDPLTQELKYNPKFEKKIPYKHPVTNEIIKKARYPEYNCSVSLQTEEIMTEDEPIIKKILEEWNDTKKTYRYITRYTFIHSDYPFRVDCSVVKMYQNNQKRMIPTYNIADANIFQNPDTYEVELEMHEFPSHYFTKIVRPYQPIEELLKSGVDLKEPIIRMLKKQIMVILSGLQRTNYPVPYDELKSVKMQYLFLIYGGDITKQDEKFFNKYIFLGPQNITLQMENIVPLNDEINNNVANIRNNYCVTEKADGMRKLLFIDHVGKIFTIDTNMNIQFTGAITKNETYYFSLFDGEHVLHDRNGKFINLFLIFDVYFLNCENVRHLNLFNSGKEEEKSSRYELIVTFVNQDASIVSIVDNKPSSFYIMYKTFLRATLTKDIFYLSTEILNKEKNNGFDYNTDGLIYTPAFTGVGGNNTKKTGNLKRETWYECFKWKPPQHNTIDFLVRSVKNENNEDIVKSINENGNNLEQVSSIQNYKTFILNVGYDEDKHGYLSNPCQMIIDDEMPKFSSNKNDNSYKAKRFIPTNPSIENAYLCNILLESVPKISNDHICLTEEDQDIVEDGTIVEFKYDQTKKEGWKWIPMRVRYDKTEMFKKGHKEFGNAYHVANSIWQTYYNPITEENVKTGKNILDMDEDIYYKKVKNTETKSLRDFHNRFVKNKIISAISKNGDTLIDLSVGKGGDIPKWREAKLSFVLGIDINIDNIENRIDGACARYLNYKKKYLNMPNMLFVNGDSTNNIKNGSGLNDEKSKQIVNAIFGNGPKDFKTLGKGVFKQYGKAIDGFDIVSCQFAIHYFFENKQTFRNFIINVIETCKEGGYFVGTSFDGRILFNKMKNIKQDEEINFTSKNNKIVTNIKKLYDQDSFENDISCLGYGIDVYQETIHKSNIEYLVNYDYFFQIMNYCGFTLLDNNEIEEIGLKNSTGLFKDMFTEMQQEIKDNKDNKKKYGDASNISKIEKDVSFMNRYFILKKQRNVNIDTLDIFGIDQVQVDVQNKETHEIQQNINVMTESEINKSIKTNEPDSPLKKRGRPPKNKTPNTEVPTPVKGSALDKIEKNKTPKKTKSTFKTKSVEK